MRRVRSNGDPLAGRVQQLMLRNFVHGEPTLSAYEAERLMRSARIRHLPVVLEGELLGVLSYRDLLEFALAQLEQEAGRVEALRAKTIESLMTRDPVTATQGTALREAALRMVRNRIGCLPIVDGATRGNARLIGLLTESDLIRAALRPAK